jgi:hypothetical protein
MENFYISQTTPNIPSLISQYFLPSSRNESPTVIIPTDPMDSGTLTATISVYELLASENIYISTNGSSLPVILTFPAIDQVMSLFIDRVQGSIRAWNIGYDGTGLYNIISPDVVKNGGPDVVALTPSSSPPSIGNQLLKFYLMLKPYGETPQAYTFFYDQPIPDGEPAPNSGAFVVTSPVMNFTFTGLATGVKPNTLVVVDASPPISTRAILNLPSGLNLWTALYGTSTLGTVPIVTNTIVLTNQCSSSVSFLTVPGVGNITIPGTNEYVLTPKTSVQLWVKFTQKTSTSATCQIVFGTTAFFTV